MERARRWEAREPDAFVSVFYGFPWSDVADIGPNVVVTATDEAAGKVAAEELMQALWRSR